LLADAECFTVMVVVDSNVTVRGRLRLMLRGSRNGG
jgi:hypothetical protein